MRRKTQKSTVDYVHNKLLCNIIYGALEENQRVVISQLAQDLGTSLIPVREALARLHSEGFVTFEYNKGYRVAPALTIEELHKLFDARLIIEMGAAETALKELSADEIDGLKEINEKIASSSYGTTYRDFHAFVELNKCFHTKLVALAKNPFLSAAYERLGYHQQIIRPSQGRGIGDIKRIVSEHRDILHALQMGNPKALRETIQAHIYNGFELYKRSMEKGATTIEVEPVTPKDSSDTA